MTDLMNHPSPTKMEAAKTSLCAPAALHLFTWRSYRCLVAIGRERVPLFGVFIDESAREFRVRQTQNVPRATRRLVGLSPTTPRFSVRWSFRYYEV